MDINIDEYIGKKIRERRTVAGLSQKILAENAGVTFQQVQKYEKGMNSLSCNRLYDFSDYLNVPVAFFFEGLPNQVRLPPLENVMRQQKFQAFNLGHNSSISDREILELSKAFKRITDPVIRRKLADVVRALAGK